MALPGWLARIVHVPVLKTLTVFADTVQTAVSAGPGALTGTIQFGGPPGPMSVGVPYAIVPGASMLLVLTPCSGTIVTGSETVASQ